MIDFRHDYRKRKKHNVRRFYKNIGDHMLANRNRRRERRAALKALRTG